MKSWVAIVLLAVAVTGVGVTQALNLVPRNVRLAAFLGGVVLVVLAAAITPSSAATALGLSAALALALYGKHTIEVDADVLDRQHDGRPLPVRDSHGLRSVLNPVYTVLYRRRMFRDPISRANLEEKSLAWRESIRRIRYGPAVPGRRKRGTLGPDQSHALDQRLKRRSGGASEN